MFVWLSRIGEVGAVWIVAAAILALLWRRPRVFLLVLIADLLGAGISGALRLAIPRDRPPLRYPDPRPLVGVPGSHSFPSGHTTSSFACATVIAALAPRLAIPAFVLAAAIGFSRVYVGVHYPLDVLAGAVLGISIGLLLLVAVRRRSSRAQRAG